MPETQPITCRTRLQFTPRGQLAVMLLHLAIGAAWLSGDASVRLAASLLAAPVLIDLGWKLWTRPRLELTVGARRGIARAAFRETVELRNRSPRAALRELRLREPRTQVADAGGAHVPWLPAQDSLRLRIAARHPRRGLAMEREFVGETDWPLALFRWSLQCSVPATMLSEPARIAIDPKLLRAADDDRDIRPSSHGETQEFFSLREYRDGEDARRIHARRSAALGELVLTVWRGSDARERCLVVDLRRSPGVPDPRTSKRLDRQLGRAAWLVDLWTREHTRFRVFAIQRELRSWDVKSLHETREVLAWLAIAQVVPYRALADDEQAQLASLPRSTWLAAGGYRERSVRSGSRHEFAGEVPA